MAYFGRPFEQDPDDAMDLIMEDAYLLINDDPFAPEDPDQRTLREVDRQLNKIREKKKS